MRKALCFILLLLFTTAVWARPIDYYGQSWNGFFVNGKINQSDTWFYKSGVEARLFNPNGNIYQQSLALGALGYRLFPSLTVWLGYMALLTLGPQTNRTFLENRLWQQMNWVWIRHDGFILIARTRFEERSLTNQSSWAYRLRQRIIFLFPKIIAHQVGIGGYEEVFFNLNRPSWLNTVDTFSQNRFFLGLELPVAKHISFWVGYLNVLNLQHPVNRMIHAYYMSLNINMGILGEPDED